MFEGMSARFSSDDGTAASRAVLTRRIVDGTIVAAVIDHSNGEGLCASGMLQLETNLGTPQFPRGRAGHLSSVAVDGTVRRQGLASDIVAYLVDLARELELERVELHATLAAEPIYRRLGFREREGGLEMRLEF